jgi:hypothetical protein
LQIGPLIGDRGLVSLELLFNLRDGFQSLARLRFLVGQLLD